MTNPTVFNATKILQEIREKEDKLTNLQDEMNKTSFELQELKRINSSNINIRWKEAVKQCIHDEKVNSSYFIKTPTFISNCIAWTYGIEVTRTVKNNVASTLSLMFTNGEVGRIQQNGKTYYGETRFFKPDMVTLKKEYSDWVEDLVQ